VSKPVDYADLEIGLHRHQGARYEVELRFNNPKSEGATPPVRGETAIDPQALLELQLRPKEYGVALASSLFAHKDVAAEYAKVKTAVESSNQFLRVKLFVGPSASELHPLRWELLTDPDTHAPLATSEKILFSRFGASNNWRNIRLRAKADLLALVAVSAPSNLAEYQLAPVDIGGEIDRARENLKGIQITVAGKDAPLTLNRLIDRLRDSKIDILYLVCHGALTLKGPRLWLQDETGKVAVTGGDELAQRISELAEPPRLVVLASCESAGSEQVSASNKLAAGELVSLAPRLAEAGVTAVLAMQGKISMETVKKAMPVFFAELLKDGQIDRALAVARGSVRERPDSWMPALFLRLKGGKIWYEPGFGEGEGDFEKWESLVHAVRSGNFTPIVGSGLGERVYGTLRDVARELGESAGFPLAEHQLSELPQVCQYLQFSQSVDFARGKFKEQLRRQALQRHSTLSADEKKLNLPLLLARVGQNNRKEDPADPYTLVARLPAQVFITANPDNLLLEALKSEDKEPDVFFFNWREKTKAGDPKPERDEQEPTAKKPLVFHVFGYFRDENSLVLTEDDYFDYLIGLIQYKPRIPKAVPAATTSTSLLFLGFQLTDWNFRVLFRLIMGQEGSSRRKDFAHVAVQVDPEEHTLINPQKARKYLERYFGDSNITIFWGSSGEFLQELGKRLASIPEEAKAVVPPDYKDW
jgi:hypothetical protein